MADNYQEALIKAIETISKSQVDHLLTLHKQASELGEFSTTCKIKF